MHMLYAYILLLLITVPCIIAFIHLFKTTATVSPTKHSMPALYSVLEKYIAHDQTLHKPKK